MCSCIECIGDQPEPTQDEIDAARYRWLRDRMKVHYEAPMSGGEKRATLTMRVGHGFLDSKIHPTTGWTDQKYFDECREKVDAAIDSAMVVTPMTTLEAQGPLDRNVSRRCTHCGCEIKHYGGRLWHEIGAKIFPQYCVNFEGPADQLHEPMELTANEQGKPTPD